MTPIKVGDVLRRHRLDAALKQKEVATLTHYHHTYVSRVERGEQAPAQEYVRRFIEALRLSEPAQTEVWRLYHTESAPETTPFHIPTGDQGRRQEMLDLPDARAFYGRAEELTTLTTWLITARCRLIGVFGMGGIGKTLLAAKVTTQVAQHFDAVFWCSLRNAPPIVQVLQECLAALANEQPATLLTDPDELLAHMLRLLRRQRCLVVLDNLETILQTNTPASLYRAGYERYGDLLQQVGEAGHQSCLLVTSREKPREFARLEGENASTRTLRLGGVDASAGEAILQDKGLVGSPAMWRALVERYSGNPLALKLIAEPIRELYDGQISEFLRENILIFGDIRDLLEQQFLRLSALARAILYWLVIEREPIARERLYENFAQRPSKSDFLTALSSLRRRSLLEQSSDGFTLQNVILEYITDRLQQQVYEEIARETVDASDAIFPQYPLMQAHTKDYVREQQVRAIVSPLVKRLVTNFGREAVEQKLQRLLASVHTQPSLRVGYAAGNILNLLSYLPCDLTGYDFSHLTIRQAHLSTIDLRDVNFTAAHFIRTSFAESFGIIAAVTVSPDGKFIAAGDAAGQLRLWLTADVTLFLTWQAHEDWILAVAFNPTSSLVATGSEDATVKVWVAATGQLQATLHGHVGRIRAVAFSPQGHLLASAGDDQRIRLWDVNSGECLWTLQGHQGWIRSIAFSPAGDTLVSGSEDRTVRLWDVQSGQSLGSCLGHTDAVESVLYSPQGELIASGGRDGTVRFWQPRTLACLRVYPMNAAKVVTALAFSPDGRHLGVASRTIDLWEVNAGSYMYMRTLPGHTNRIRGLCFHPDGRSLVSGSEDRTVKIWDVQSGQRLKTFQGFTDWITALAVSPDGKTLASASFRNVVRLWPLDATPSPHSLSGHGGWIPAVAFSPDGRLLVSGSEDRTVKIWRMADCQCVATLQGHRRRVRTVSFSTDGALVASGSSDQTIRLWDVQTAQCIAVLTGHTDAVMALAFRPQHNTLASSSYDHTIKLWEMETGHCLTTYHGHPDWIRTLAFSPDGRLLASGSDDRTVKLWDVDTGQCLNRMTGHRDRVRAVAFSPHGNRLASGSEDQTIKLWDIRTGTCCREMRGHANHVTCLVFSSDGQTIISGSDDATIKIWNPSTGACLTTLRSERLYERMNITGATGLTEAQKTSLKWLGAVET